MPPPHNQNVFLSRQIFWGSWAAVVYRGHHLGLLQTNDTKGPSNKQPILKYEHRGEDEFDRGSKFSAFFLLAPWLG